MISDGLYKAFECTVCRSVLVNVAHNFLTKDWVYA
jgi:hypothetical protein